MEPLFLSKNEIAELTGYKLSAHQCRWLRERGWVFEQNCNKHPIVGRSYAKSRLGGSDHGDTAPRITRPNFAALNAR